MNDDRFRELQARISEPLDAAIRRDDVRRAELRSLADDIICDMKAEGKAMELTDEEERMLWAFRRFKLRMRKHGETFNWQTRKPEGVQVVEETALVLHPNEAL